MTPLTREVTVDLWPLYLSGDVSAATRKLVEQFLITAVIAGAFWIAFFVALFRGRRAVLVRLR